MLYLRTNFFERFKHLLIGPIIYSLIIPLVILDIWVEIYHRICFIVYKFPYVKRLSYIKIDRHKLEYLNAWQKFDCVYCGYVNGVTNYWSKIAAESEKFWCGIKHKKSDNFIEQEHHKDFTEYGDKEDYNKKYINK